MGYMLTIQHDGQLTEDQAEFCLNTKAMGRHVRLMIDIGMAHDTGKGPTWDPQRPTGTTGSAPTIPSHKLAGGNEEWWTTVEEITAALAAWDAQAEDSTRRLVESFERYSALPDEEWDHHFEQHRYDTAGILDLGTMHPDSWAEWIDYLRLAAAHDGFRNS